MKPPRTRFRTYVQMPFTAVYKKYVFIGHTHALKLLQLTSAYGHWMWGQMDIVFLHLRLLRAWVTRLRFIMWPNVGSFAIFYGGGMRKFWLELFHYIHPAEYLLDAENEMRTVAFRTIKKSSALLVLRFALILYYIKVKEKKKETHYDRLGMNKEPTLLKNQVFA